MPSSATPTRPVVVLVHGFPTSSIDWYDVVETLSADHLVCMVDFPGFGFSDKPADEHYTLTRDAELLDYYLQEVVGADRGTVVAHDRGDSVALAFLARVTAKASSFEITNLVLSNANLFLPLSNLTDFQRQALDPGSWPAVVEVLTPEMLAAGMGDVTFTPSRGLDDPAVRALADTFAVHDGVNVLHDTIQYLVQRSDHETEWLDILARSSIPTTLVWGLDDTVSPLRVASYVWLTYLGPQARRQHVLGPPEREPLPPARSAPAVHRRGHGRHRRSHRGPRSRTALEPAGSTAAHRQVEPRTARRQGRTEAITGLRTRHGRRRELRHRLHGRGVRRDVGRSHP